ncbi:hypothetical protein B4N89_39170 [Embleya scabrispora]|uniref:Uncharacterized protein n=2 Tax=Embleya scabrispora TaxID=159449 RepID=A0A1T3NN20_9ACTN|nr:hypothetical protein B4N89_39170 [Embleya scabrispora]
MPGLLREMLPAADVEPPIPDVLPGVRAGGARRRRRRRLGVGVASLVAGALLAGTAVGALALTSDDDAPATGGPAAAPSRTVPQPPPSQTAPHTGAAQPPTVSGDEFLRNPGPIHDAVLAALRAHLPAGVVEAEDQDEGDRTLFFRLTRDDGTVTTIVLGGGEPAIPGAEPVNHCQLGPQLDTKTGNMLQADWSECVRSVLPDGSKAITGKLRQGRETSVSVSLITPAGLTYDVSSSNRDKFGTILSGSALNSAELLALVANQDVIAAIPSAPTGSVGPH